MVRQTKQRDGKREGAGRKKTTGKCVMFGATAEVTKILNSIKDKSAFINAAIIAYTDPKEKTPTE